MKRKHYTYWLAIFISLSCVWPADSSDLRTRQNNLYPYQSSVMFQDDFMTGTASSGTIGILGWTFTAGTTSQLASETNRNGIVRRDTSAVINTLARFSLSPGATETILDPSSNHNQVWIVRLNTNDANTLTRIGAFNTIAGLPPANGLYIEKLDADTNWFCVARSGGVQTRTDSGVAINTNFNTLSYTRNASGVQFQINQANVCSLITTNIPTTFLSPAIQITNSAAASKTIDIDYYQLMIMDIIR